MKLYISKKIFFFILGLVLFLKPTSVVFANAPNVDGYVKVAGTHAPVPDVIVKWTDGNGQWRLTKTDGNGHFFFPSWQNLSDGDRSALYHSGQASTDGVHAFGCGENPHSFSALLPAGWSGTFSTVCCLELNNAASNLSVDLIYSPPAPTPTPTPSPTPTNTPTPTITPTPTTTPTPDFRHPSNTPAPPTPTRNPSIPPPTPTSFEYFRLHLGIIKPTPTPH